VEYVLQRDSRFGSTSAHAFDWFQIGSSDVLTDAENVGEYGDVLAHRAADVVFEIVSQPAVGADVIPDGDTRALDDFFEALEEALYDLTGFYGLLHSKATVAFCSTRPRAARAPSASSGVIAFGPSRSSVGSRAATSAVEPVS
jgi:hypothetical protein